MARAPTRLSLSHRARLQSFQAPAILLPRAPCAGVPRPGAALLAAKQLGAPRAGKGAASVATKGAQQSLHIERLSRQRLVPSPRKFAPHAGGAFSGRRQFQAGAPESLLKRVKGGHLHGSAATGLPDVQSASFLPPLQQAPLPRTLLAATGGGGAAPWAARRHGLPVCRPRNRRPGSSPCRPGVARPRCWRSC